MKMLCKRRQLVADDLREAGILQADSIEHTRRTFGDPWKVIAITWLDRRPLKGNGAQDIEVVKVPELASIPKRAGRRNYRI